jgi:crotonobetainyl-CoA:carnitine CoA-transferase CaiB-like acyl-CoA transferase
MLDEPHNGPLAEMIGNALAVLPSAVAIERLAAHDVALAPVLSREEAMHNPWLEENAFFHEFDDADLGRCRVVRT